MMIKKKLFDVSPSPFNGGIGIIQALSTFNPPWSEDNINPVILDTFYYGNHSGGKIISPLVSRYIDCDNPTLTPENVSGLAAIVNALCHPTWVRMWDVYKSEYEPTENYNMVEEGEREKTTDYGKTHLRTDNLQHSKTGTETETPNTTETITPNLTTNIDKSIYGFNSAESSPSEENTERNTGTNTTQITGTNQMQYNTVDADTGTQNYVDGGEDNETENHTLSRHGNIGVTTTQQMLQSDIDLWKWSFFYDILFPSLDRILTIPVY